MDTIACTIRDPEYVEPEDRQRFFKATFDVLEVLLCAEEGQPPGDARARAQSVHTVACGRGEPAD